MKKLLAIFLAVVFTTLLTLSVSAAVNVVGDPHANYPYLDGYTPAEGSNILKGKVIGGATGWDNNPAIGAAAAFNGNHGDCYDQYEPADKSVEERIKTEYPGMMMEEKYILTSARVWPTADADWQAERMNGAAIQGSNDGETWVTLYQFTAPAVVGEHRFYDVTEFENNTGYTMFRYVNLNGHTDCRELQFFGYVAPAAEPEQPEQPSSPETADFTVKAVAVAVVMTSAMAAVAVSRKKNAR